MLSLQTRLSMLNKQATFDKGLVSCVKKDLILKEDLSTVKAYVSNKFKSLFEAIENGEAEIIYEMVEDDKVLREFYRVITGDNIEETGKKTLQKRFNETYPVITDPATF